jgi:hypothetical protein
MKCHGYGNPVFESDFAGYMKSWWLSLALVEFAHRLFDFSLCNGSLGPYVSGK